MFSILKTPLNISFIYNKMKRFLPAKRHHASISASQSGKYESAVYLKSRTRQLIERKRQILRSYNNLFLLCNIFQEKSIITGK